MNRKACLIAILYYIYQLIDSLHNKSIVIITFYFVGIIMLMFSLTWDLIQSKKNQINQTKEVPYVNFAFLFIILEMQIENIVTYIELEYYIGIIFYIEGTLAFGILTIYEYIRFFFYSKMSRKFQSSLFSTITVKYLGVAAKESVGFEHEKHIFDWRYNGSRKNNYLPDHQKQIT